MNEQTVMPTAIAMALVKAQMQAKSVEKTSVNTFHRYKYASAEAVIEESRGALAKAGLAVVMIGWDIVAGRLEDDHDRVLVRYLLVHESGATWPLAAASTPVIPEKGRPEDKAEATALTYNLGYALRGLLLLPRVSEGDDADRRDDSGYEPRRQQRRDERPRQQQRPVQQQRREGAPVQLQQCRTVEELRAWCKARWPGVFAEHGPSAAEHVITHAKKIGADPKTVDRWLGEATDEQREDAAAKGAEHAQDAAEEPQNEAPRESAQDDEQPPAAA